MDSVQPDGSLEERNWAELPPDLLCQIFKKLGQYDILCIAQAVCSSWLRVSYEPQLWKCIDMRNSWHPFGNESCPTIIEKLAMTAIDRSGGQLEEFSIEYFGTDKILQFVVDRAGAFKRLCLLSCDQISDGVLIEAAKKLPLLEELEITFPSFNIKEVVEAVGCACPKLKSLQLNCQGPQGIKSDIEALAIAQNMHNLQRLQLLGGILTDDGLKAILEGCPHLVSLDLRQCFNVQLEASLKKKCMERISDLRLPYVSTHDWHYTTEFSQIGSSDEEYPSGFSDIDILSDDAYYDLSDEGDFYLAGRDPGFEFSDAWDY